MKNGKYENGKDPADDNQARLYDLAALRKKKLEMEKQAKKNHSSQPKKPSSKFWSGISYLIYGIVILYFAVKCQILRF